MPSGRPGLYALQHESFIFLPDLPGDRGRIRGLGVAVAQGTWPGVRCMGVGRELLASFRGSVRCDWTLVRVGSVLLRFSCGSMRSVSCCRPMGRVEKESTGGRVTDRVSPALSTERGRGDACSRALAECIDSDRLGDLGIPGSKARRLRADGSGSWECSGQPARHRSSPRYCRRVGRGC